MDVSSLFSTLLSSSSITNVSKATGTEKGEVKDVLTAALPALLNGAKEQAEDKSTQAGFLEALASHAKDDTSSVSGFLKNVDLKDGAAIVKHLIGGSSSSTTKEIAKESGVSATKVTSILSAIAPLLMSLLGKESESSSTGGVDLLGSLVKNVDMGSVISGLLGGTSSKTTKKTTSSTSKTSSSSKLSKAASLLGGLLGKK
ncbi:MAG: DUF937 domain-containing protein [Spirochaetaceae bacterium]|nr:DUF937 domain-containing protein [Spirochaetaceae bacterium]